MRFLDGKTIQVKGVRGFIILVAGAGLYLIFMATLLQIRPFVFLIVFFVALCAWLLINISRQKSLWKKPADERLELWNRQMEQGKFKNREELYHHYIASCYAEIGNFEEALSHTLLAIYLAEAKETSNQKILDVLHTNHVAFLIDLERWGEATEILEGLETRADVHKRSRGAILENRARLALYQQNVASARMLIDEVGLLHIHGTAANRSWLLILQAELAFAEGDVDEARKKADEVMAHTNLPRHLRRAEQLKERTE